MLKALGYIIGLPLLIILGMLVFLEAGNVAQFFLEHITQYGLYAMGFAAMAAVMLLTWKLTGRLRTLSHELCHAAVCLCFMQKVRNIDVNADGSGKTTYEAGRIGDIFIALAPYCLPLLTYITMIVECFAGNEKNATYFGIATGATYAWHVVCGISQMKPYQTDIKRETYVISYSFIAIFCIFNLYVVILSIDGGLTGAASFLWTHFIDDMPKVTEIIGKAVSVFR